MTYLKSSFLFLNDLFIEIFVWSIWSLGKNLWWWLMWIRGEVKINFYWMGCYFSSISKLVVKTNLFIQSYSLLLSRNLWVTETIFAVKNNRKMRNFVNFKNPRPSIGWYFRMLGISGFCGISRGTVD